MLEKTRKSERTDEDGTLVGGAPVRVCALIVRRTNTRFLNGDFCAGQPENARKKKHTKEAMGGAEQALHQH